MKRVLLIVMMIFMAACSTDDTQERNVLQESYTLVYTTQDVPDFVSVLVGSEITYQDSFEFIDSEYNYDTNKVIVETQPGPIKIESNLYIENGTPVSIILYDSLGNIVDEKTSTSEQYNYIYEF